MSEITPILMPKWGLSMKEGKLSAWHVKEGEEIKPGQEIMDVETDKIANAVEAADGGTVRRIVAKEGETLPVRALLAVLAPATVSDEDVETYVSSYEMPAADGEGEDAGPAYHFTDLPAGRIRYAERAGEGTPVVLVHGFGGDLDNWLFNIDALAETAPVYALDLPGHGQSVKSARPADLGLMASTLIAFLDEMKIEKAHLVGHSMGGLVAGKTAAEHPGRVASITLICTAGLGADINAEYVEGFVKAEGRKDLKPVVGLLFRDQELVSRSLIQDLLKYKRLDGVKDFLNELSGNLFSGGKQAEGIAEGIAASGVPVQVIWGEDDAIIPVSHASNLRDVQPHVISGAGHMVQMEQSNEVNRLIRDFVG